MNWSHKEHTIEMNGANFVTTIKLPLECRDLFPQRREIATRPKFCLDGVKPGDVVIIGYDTMDRPDHFSESVAIEEVLCLRAVMRRVLSITKSGKTFRTDCPEDGVFDVRDGSPQHSSMARLGAIRFTNEVWISLAKKSRDSILESHLRELFPWNLFSAEEKELLIIFADKPEKWKPFFELLRGTPEGETLADKGPQARSELALALTFLHLKKKHGN